MEWIFVRFPSPAPDLSPYVKILRFMASVGEIRKKRKDWIPPAFGGHLTFLKMSRIRGTQIAKPKRATLKTPSVACIKESIAEWYSFNEIGP